MPGHYAYGGLIAMRATALMLGCLLSLATLANAKAAGVSAANGSAGCRDHASLDRAGSSSHEAGAASGDALARHGSGSAAAPSSSDSHSGGSSGRAMDDSSTRFGGGDTSPDGSSHGSSGLGWQSLLPGSIQ
jgi:hypothetical protein